MAGRTKPEATAAPERSDWRSVLVGFVYLTILIVTGVATLIGSTLAEGLLRVSLIASLATMGWGIISNLPRD